LRTLSRVTDDMSPGERVVWSGQPDRRVWLTASDWSSGVGLIVVTAFFIFWEHWVLTDRTVSGGRRYPWPFAAWGVLVLVLVLISTISLPFARHRRKARTTYVLTNMRARVMVGRRMFETAIGTRHQVWWSRSETHVTVVWADTAAATPFGRFSPLRQGRSTVFFADVRDGATLITALTST
jgi:hypothetical protein